MGMRDFSAGHWRSFPCPSQPEVGSKLSIGDYNNEGPEQFMLRIHNALGGTFFDCIPFSMRAWSSLSLSHVTERSAECAERTSFRRAILLVNIGEVLHPETPVV